MEIKRKLYKRGSSYETTIPMPLLFSLDLNKKHNIFFSYKKTDDKWFIDIAEDKTFSKNKQKKLNKIKSTDQTINPSQIKRKLYKRGSSHETTIPLPLLVSIDSSQDKPTQTHNVWFKYDCNIKKWYVEILTETANEKMKNQNRNKT